MAPARRLAIVAMLLLAGGAVASAQGIRAVVTPGFGTLTKCRDWLVTKSCSTYHHVALPERVAVGDGVDLDFGSNPKEFTFHVAAIRRNGGDCTILTAAGDTGDRIEVAPCRPADAEGTQQ